MTLEWRETILFQIFQNQDPPSSSESVSYMLHSTTVGCYTGVKKRRGYDIGRHGFQTHMHFLMSALKKLRYISGEEKGKSVWAPSSQTHITRPNPISSELLTNFKTYYLVLAFYVYSFSRKAANKSIRKASTKATFISGAKFKALKYLHLCLGSYLEAIIGTKSIMVCNSARTSHLCMHSSM